VPRERAEKRALEYGKGSSDHARLALSVRSTTTM
jgi:hypothetical protein